MNTIKFTFSMFIIIKIIHYFDAFIVIILFSRIQLSFKTGKYQRAIVNRIFQHAFLVMFIILLILPMICVFLLDIFAIFCLALVFSVFGSFSFSFSLSVLASVFLPFSFSLLSFSSCVSVTFGNLHYVL